MICIFNSATGFADENQAPDSSAGRLITADLNHAKGPRSMVWQDCVGAGRVAEGLRESGRRQLEECRGEIGFKYIRMHGLLQDELGVYSEDAKGNLHYNWQYIDDVYDFLLSIGMKPFVEIGFMPGALASGDGQIFWWKARVTPPNDYVKWDKLVSALVAHWIERYGEKEVAAWRFEIWNEPNYPGFWHPGTHVTPQDAYFELYAHTARAVKSVSMNYAVGGPAGAGPVWTKEIIEFCQANNLPIDFSATIPMVWEMDQVDWTHTATASCIFRQIFVRWLTSLIASGR
jgi:xylan 1,4-beta-xylosidase